MAGWKGRLFSARLRKGRSSDAGIALPLSLILLSLSAVIAAAVFSGLAGAVERESARRDIAQAQDLARAGVEAAVADLLGGGAAAGGTVFAGGSISGFGTYRASGRLLTGSLWRISASGKTWNGGSARVVADIDLRTKRVARWDESP